MGTLNKLEKMLDMKKGKLPFLDIIDKNVCLVRNFPIQKVLSLEYLIDFWREKVNSSNSFHAEMATKVIEYIDRYPELAGDIDDIAIFEDHKDFMEILMSVIYSEHKNEYLIKASASPFSFNIFHQSGEFSKKIDFDNAFIEGVSNISPELLIYERVVMIYATILSQYYGTSVPSLEPQVVRFVDKITGLDVYYQFNVDTSFIEINVKGELPQISASRLKGLVNNIVDISDIMKILPPEMFEIRGFATFNMVNCTLQENISALKYDLLEKNSLLDNACLKDIQNKLRSMYGLNSLEMGIAMVPSDMDTVIPFMEKYGLSLMSSEVAKLDFDDFIGSIYEKSSKSSLPMLVENFDEYDEIGKIEEVYINKGYKNVLIAPLFYNDKKVGFLEIASKTPYQITSLNMYKIFHVLSLFSVAAKRNLEHFETNIQTIIKEECTAIHPSVEWRFRNAASNLIFDKLDRPSSEMEDIVFDNVYPLFGVSDIRNSSEHRNKTIQNDLLHHLYIAKDILEHAVKVTKLPILDELEYRIEQHIDDIIDGISSGDEINILEFIKQDVEPLLTHLGDCNEELSTKIQNYRNELNPELGTVYKERKAYEESVSMLNESISSFLDIKNKEAQEMYPHYFEKYKTDGVEHGIYIGASIANEKEFDKTFLKNIRLWQLITMCSVARITDQVKTKMPVPMDTTHLILVQATTLTIKFRTDEKKFDVDGTYNLRYEIMKKRIDKAVIKGTQERLTQPNMIAIVYSQNKEAQEYIQYLKYLNKRGYVEQDIEEYGLEELQGIKGLRALRVRVKMT